MIAQKRNVFDAADDWRKERREWLADRSCPHDGLFCDTPDCCEYKKPATPSPQPGTAEQQEQTK